MNLVLSLTFNEKQLGHSVYKLGIAQSGSEDRGVPGRNNVSFHIHNSKL
jgi:hypothetical protein